MSVESDQPQDQTKKRGRPKSTAVAAQKKGNRNAVGRPKGDAAVINEYKARMLASPKSRKVLDSIFDAALNDEHKNQSSAWKLIMDRILPVAAFEKDIIKGSGKNSISINITGVGSTSINSQEFASSSASDDNEDYIEGEVIDS